MTTAPEMIVRNRDRIAALAQAYEGDMVGFLRDLVAIPAESSHEKPVIERVRREMEKVGFDEIRTDPMGNLLGRIGSGKKIIMMDSHTDAVGVGDPKEWSWDPYKGKVEDGFVYGRASSDQRGGMASLVYAGKIIKELGLLGDYTLYVVGSVQEEDCDGLAWLYILKEDGIPADCVVLTEPTNLKVYRGQRGRMEIEVHFRGRSCHASAPERGDNPIYKMTPLVREIEVLNTRLRDDAFLGKGTIAVTRRPLPVAVAVRGARRLLHSPGPPPDHGRDQGKRGGGGQGAARRTGRGSGNPELRSSQLHGTDVLHGKVLSNMGIGRDSPPGAGRGQRLCGLARQAAGGGQVDVQHQRRGLHGIDGRAYHRFRAGRRRCGAQRAGARAHSPPGGSRQVLRGVSAHVCEYSGE